MRVAVLLAAVCATVQVAGADIYVWIDAAGGRHFTNHRDDVPEAQRDAARVLIVERPRLAAPAVAPAPAPAAAADPPAVEAAYRAGLADGQRLEVIASGGGGGGGGAATGGTVEIHGPLAVASASAREDDALGWLPAGGWDPGWGYYPFVTTGFDRGRSRHQTLRMLLQDQFALDRAGPFAYQRWNRPGLGPPLAPFLPRGLPLPVQQYGRVIYR